MLPDYWLTRPTVNLDEGAQNAFDGLLDTTLSMGGCPTIQFTLPWPKWQFLCHLADHHDIALHGSGDPNIALFEPRQSNDLNEFGNQKAVYAASDGLWAMFFAIVDRERVMSITNACVRLADEMGNLHGPYYVFSVSQQLFQISPGERAPSISCHAEHSLSSHPSHSAPMRSISHSSQVLYRCNPWRSSRLHRQIFLS
jgi:hypothetical protein